MKKAAAAAILVLGASLFPSAAAPGGPPQAPLATSTNDQLLERIEAEIAFAKGLAELTAARAAEWRPLIARAEEIVAAMRAGRMRGDPAADVLRAEKVLAPIGQAAKTLHHPLRRARPHRHELDVVLARDGGRHQRHVHHRAEADGRVPRLLLHPEPGLASTRIVAAVQPRPASSGSSGRVAEGRWEVAAVHWVEGDKNLASGEALARHLLYTRQFMKEHFGLSPRTCRSTGRRTPSATPRRSRRSWRAAGVKHYYMCRGGDCSKSRRCSGGKAPDGSRVLVEPRDHAGTTTTSARTTPTALLDFCEEDRPAGTG